MIHFQVGFDGLLFVRKLTKGVLQGRARFAIAYNLYLYVWIKSTKDQGQIFVGGNGIELCDKEHVFGYFGVGIGQVAEHFQSDSATVILLFLQLFSLLCL